MNEESKLLWGIKWKHLIEPLPNNVYSESGCLLDIFYNEEFGKIALLYITPNDINISSNNYGKLLDQIRNKWLKNKPFIIFSDIKYKQICIEWNNSNNTVYGKEEFESYINKLSL